MLYMVADTLHYFQNNNLVPQTLYITYEQFQNQFTYSGSLF